MDFPTNIEMIDPILCVSDLDRSVSYYTEILGFEAADWNTGDFTSVSLVGNGIYLAQNAQGQPGTWVWVGVGNVRAVYELYQVRGAIIRMAPTKYPWALELQVEDPDGNVLRFGSDPDD
ncbi:MAG: glyoxalase superfamily protein [Gammaproteobacteria bacterium]|nr:glyoxalase superfamily protein [Gammaproteobacteria bacterium]